MTRFEMQRWTTTEGGGGWSYQPGPSLVGSVSVVRGYRSADELMAELEKDPAFVERQRARIEKQEESRRRYMEAAAGLLEDLHLAGFEAGVVSDLRTSGDERVIPILSRWLPQVEYEPLKQDIVSTLGSSWGRPGAARPLVDEFRRTSPPDDPEGFSLRWFIGDSLERVADESVLDDLIDIAVDPGNGRDRSFVVAALGNMRAERERVLPVILGLFDDPAMAPYAAIAAGKLRAVETKSRLEQLAADPRDWVRDEARKALKKLRS